MTARCLCSFCVLVGCHIPSMEGRSRDRPMTAPTAWNVVAVEPSMEGRSRDRPMETVIATRLASVSVLQWRGGHVTARCPSGGGRRYRRLQPSMEGRSRDRPMQNSWGGDQHRKQTFNGGAVT